MESAEGNYFTSKVMFNSDRKAAKIPHQLMNNVEANIASSPFD
jgi:hypothetical protein